MRLAVLLAPVTAFLPMLAEAGSAPVGIAFAQSEAATTWCRDADPAKAIACATAKCRGEAGFMIDLGFGRDVAQNNAGINTGASRCAASLMMSKMAGRSRAWQAAICVTRRLQRPADR